MGRGGNEQCGQSELGFDFFCVFPLKISCYFNSGLYKIISLGTGRDGD